MDTRPAALACLRIIIAALNILIAVSFSCISLLFINTVRLMLWEYPLVGKEFKSRADRI